MKKLDLKKVEKNFELTLVTFKTTKKIKKKIKHKKEEKNQASMGELCKPRLISQTYDPLNYRH